MRTLRYVPNGYKDIVDTYGDPLAKGFEKEFIQRFTLPFTMRASWNEKLLVKTALMHRDVGAVVVDALREILDFGGMEFLLDNDLDRWGGCWNPRLKTGSTQISTHAWAIAVDICPAKGPYGKVSKVPAFIVEAFTKRGFINGGVWKVPDGMHNQACRGY